MPAAESSNPAPAESPARKAVARGRALLGSPRVRKGGLAFAIAFLLFGLLGYFWLPGFAHHRAEQALSELLHRPVSFAQLEIQPYALEATVRGFRLGNREGEQALAGFDTLVANLSVASLWNKGVVLDAVRLENPYVNLVRQEDGSFNVSDLAEEFLGAREERGGAFPYAVNNLDIRGGRISLEDRQGGGSHEIADLQLVLPRLSSFAREVDKAAQPRFSATLDGAQINLAGGVRPYAEHPDGQLQIHFQALDLARLASFSPVPLPVQLKSAKLDTELTLGFAAGDDSRLTLQGQVSLHQVQAGLAGLDAGLERLSFRVDAPDLTSAPVRLDGVALARATAQRRGESRPFLDLAALQLEHLRLDLDKHRVEAGPLRIDGLDFSLARSGEASLDVLDTLAAVQNGLQGRGAKAARAPAPAASNAPAGPAWAWTLAGLQLKEGQVQFLDKTVTKAVPLRLQSLALTLGGLDSAATAPVDLSLEGRINERGSLALSGQVNPATQAGELQVKLAALDLVPLQGWIPHRMGLALSKGNLSAQGRLKFGGAPLGVQYQGDGHLEELALLDKESAQALLRWQKLALTGLDLNTAPLAVKVDDVALTRFFARLLVTPQGDLQLGRILGREAGPPAALAPVAAAPAAPAPANGTALLPGESVAAAPVPPPAGEQVARVQPRREALPVHVGNIRLDGGVVVFNDLFIKPNYSANLSGLSGQIGPLAPGQRGKLKLQGKVERTAPLVVTGELEPFSQELFLDIKAQARGIDLPSFSPYSGRYMGYLIQKGKLSVDVRYHIEKGQLEANNHIFLDQFTLGDQVDSPDALSVPIKLGLALLKNSRGEIDIDLPVSGSLNDPQFSIGGIVFKAIINLLVKAVASPFTLLASIVGGGGGDLSYVDFNSGLTTLTPATEQRLQELAKALVDRPALTLEVTGMADPVADAEGYKRSLVERQVKARKVADDVAQGKAAASIRDVSLSPEEYEKYLKQVYKDAKFDKPRNMIGLTKGLPVNEMEALLITHMQVEEGGYAELANRRGKAVRDWLVEQGQIPTERVFLLPAQVTTGDPASPGNRVAFSLR